MTTSTATRVRITNSDLKVGAKFGYRLIKGVTSREITFVNTNGSKPSRNPAVGARTVSRSEFLQMVNGD